MKYRRMSPEELEALALYANEYGAKWKSCLVSDWYKAKVYRSWKSGKEYPVLHRLRNELGPRWLAGFKLMKEEA